MSKHVKAKKSRKSKLKSQKWKRKHLKKVVQLFIVEVIGAILLAVAKAVIESFFLK
jgi:hypothetical protein